MKRSTMPRMLTLAVPLMAGACATSPLPREHAKHAAASPHAEPASRGVVTAALTQEPPLPGDVGPKWPGLRQSVDAPEGHGHPHRHGHGGNDDL